MSNELLLRNRQRTRKIDLRLLRRVAVHLLEELLHLEFEIGVTLVNSWEMSRINERYLRHAGSTDVITFNYSEQGSPSLDPAELQFEASLPPHPNPLPRGEGAAVGAVSEQAHVEASSHLFGDIYICVDEAVIQSKRFGTSWQEEIVRYSVHGILHLAGYDDRNARLRKSMKRVEDKLVAELTAHFPLLARSRVHRRHG